jgi:hypothetical protein
MYPLLVACKSQSPSRRQAAYQVLNEVRQHSATLVEQAQLVSVAPEGTCQQLLGWSSAALHCSRIQPSFAADLQTVCCMRGQPCHAAQGCAGCATGSCGTLLQVSQELIRIAILWAEMWHEALEEASRCARPAQSRLGMLPNGLAAAGDRQMTLPLPS